MLTRPLMASITWPSGAGGPARLLCAALKQEAIPSDQAAAGTDGTTAPLCSAPDDGPARGGGGRGGTGLLAVVAVLVLDCRWWRCWLVAGAELAAAGGGVIGVETAVWIMKWPDTAAPTRRVVPRYPPRASACPIL